MGPYPGTSRNAAFSNALTLLNSIVTLDNVDHLARIEVLDMQLFDTAMTKAALTPTSSWHAVLQAASMKQSTEQNLPIESEKIRIISAYWPSCLAGLLLSGAIVL